MNRKLALISTLILLGFVFAVLDSQPIEKSVENVQIVSDQKILSIGGTRIHLEIADEPSEREHGLSGRESLGEDEGLLFIFDEPGIYPFWMKEMRFPIDIIWIDQNWTVVDITKNATPESFPQTFSSKKPARYALEVNSGFVHQAAVAIGDEVVFSNLFELEPRPTE